MATDNTTTNQIWQHRLLQLDYLPAGELARRFNLLNPRSHPEAQKDATETSLEKVQWIDEISLSTNGDGPPSLVDNPDAVLFDGHERVEIVLARFGPDALVPVKWYRLTKEETDFALLVKDQTTGMAEYIPERLAELMERTRAMTDDSRLAGMLERLKAQAGVNGNQLGWTDAFGRLPQGDKSPFQQMTFTLHDEQVNEVVRALNLAKQKGEFEDSPNENSNGNALAFVCEVFITTVGNGQG